MLKALFVDFDGTLVDSLPALWKCYCLFLSHHGISGSNEEFVSLMGPPIYQIVAILKDKYALNQSVDELVAEYEHIVSLAYETNMVLFPWALEVLQKHKNAGKRLAIVTSAPVPFVEQILESNGISGLFEMNFGSRYGELAKPHPAIYLRALNEMNLLPEEVIAIEDSSNGLESAQSAGITTIAFIPAQNSSLSSGPMTATSWQDVDNIINQREKSNDAIH